MLLNWAIFSVDFAPQYLIFKISYDKFPFLSSKDKDSTHNCEQFSGYFIEIKQILSILQ